MEKITGKALLLRTEEHCEETIVCSKRLRYHIEQRMQGIIDEYDMLESRIKAVLLNGAGVYDPSSQKVINLSKRTK